MTPSTVGARFARLLLALVSARGRALTAAELVEASGSRSLYLDLDVIRVVGWPLVVEYDDAGLARWRIPEPRAPRIDWETQPLGAMPDGELARLLGVPAGTVRSARHCRGIAATRPARRWDWSAVPLGKESDSAIARRLGTSPGTVRQARVARKIAPCPAVTPRRDGVPLGAAMDVEIARQLGVTRSAVSMQRRQRGIPAAPRAARKRS